MITTKLLCVFGVFLTILQATVYCARPPYRYQAFSTPSNKTCETCVLVMNRMLEYTESPKFKLHFMRTVNYLCPQITNEKDVCNDFGNSGSSLIYMILHKNSMERLCTFDGDCAAVKSTGLNHQLIDSIAFGRFPFKQCMQVVQKFKDRCKDKGHMKEFKARLIPKCERLALANGLCTKNVEELWRVLHRGVHIHTVEELCHINLASNLYISSQLN